MEPWGVTTEHSSTPVIQTISTFSVSSSLIHPLFKKYFYWSTLDLQCCVSFCCTEKWIRYAYRYTHPFLASQVTQMLKNLPAIQETQVQPLGQEDPLEKGMVTHSSVLA